MDSKLLDYIILGIIFLIAINMLLNIFDKRDKEGMNGATIIESKPEELKIETQPVPQIMQIPELPKPEPIVNCKVNAALDILAPQTQITPDIQEYNNIAPKMQEIKSDVKSEPKKFTNDEIQAYHQNMLEFNEEINNTSAGVDIVDKINQLYTAENNEMIGLKGQTIGQIYNGLTQKIIDRKKKCVHADCLIPPVYDNLTKLPSYVMDAGNNKYFRQGLMYEDDNVQTGAKFYDQIEAFDSDFEEYPLY